MAAIYSNVNRRKYQERETRDGEPSKRSSNLNDDIVYSQVRRVQPFHSNEIKTTDADVTYSAVSFPTQDPPQRGEAQHHHDDPLTQPASKVVTSGHTTERLLLISLCCLFFVLALTLGVLYALGNTSLRGNQATITQLQKREEELNRTLQDKENHIVQLQTEKETLQSNVTGNQATITQLQNKQEELNRRLQENQANITQLQKQQEDLNRTLQDKEKKIKELEAEKQKLHELPKGDDCCAKDWKYFSGMCYYFSTDKKTWTDSRDACVAEGGHLVIVSSTEEQNFLKKSAPFTSEHFYWVALTDAVKEGDWRWLDGTSLSATPWIWYSNQPDNWKGNNSEHPEGENCAAMVLSSTLYSLIDKFCDAEEDSFYRVCEAKTRIK